jgi:RNA polymerase sigma-70 factor (ECF subfamily)
MSIRNEDVATKKLGPEVLEQYRRELTGYCYRMLGSAFDAEDAVQELMLRAWRGADGFEGRAAARSWLYRIATNICIDMLRGRERRAQPMDFGPSRGSDDPLGGLMPDHVWLHPIPDHRVLTGTDPAELAAQRETIRLAFVAALHYLPARQRAVLILREVLGWPAAEVATLLGVTVASVNSALQRARATLAGLGVAVAQPRPVPAAQRALLARYVDAFERYDVSSLVALMREDVVISMPPLEFWMRGPANAGGWYRGRGAECNGSRLVPIAANGRPAFAQYRADPAGGHTAFAIQVLEITGDKIAEIHNFVENDLFEVFGLPGHLAAAEGADAQHAVSRRHPDRL